jgi:hypothetical protein
LDDLAEEAALALPVASPWTGQPALVLSVVHLRTIDEVDLLVLKGSALPATVQPPNRDVRLLRLS